MRPDYRASVQRILFEIILGLFDRTYKFLLPYESLFFVDKLIKKILDGNQIFSNSFENFVRMTP